MVSFIILRFNNVLSEATVLNMLSINVFYPIWDELYD
jgi:hypothetical protein